MQGRSSSPVTQQVQARFARGSGAIGGDAAASAAEPEWREVGRGGAETSAPDDRAWMAREAPSAHATASGRKHRLSRCFRRWITRRSKNRAASGGRAAQGREPHDQSGGQAQSAEDSPDVVEDIECGGGGGGADDGGEEAHAEDGAELAEALVDRRADGELGRRQ